MIVKNEAHVIRRCLRSVRPFIDSYSISDTGSTDNTMEIIREELAGLPGVLKSDSWRGFGPSRNVARSRTTGDYILSIDADEVLEHLGGPSRLSPEYDFFMLKQVHADMIFWITRITRNDPRWEWKDKVHNYLEFHGESKGTHLENLQIRPYFDSHQNISGNKFLGHLAHYESAPITPRNVFYHAQTLAALNRNDEAIEKYLHRAAMGGWQEEIYYSMWKAGELMQLSGRPVEEVTRMLWKAYTYRPSRYEALVHLCEIHSRNRNWDECYRISLVQPEPSSDILFIDPRAEWRVLEEHALAAYYLGKIAEARQFFQRVARYNLSPVDRERTEKNLSFCDTREMAHA